MSAYTAIKATSIPLQNASQDAIDAIEARKGTERLVEIGPPRLRSGTRVQIDAGPLEGLFGVLERESTDRTRVTSLLETLRAAHVVVDSDCLAEAEAA
jgi:hypothetical protein